MITRDCCIVNVLHFEDIIPQSNDVANTDAFFLRFSFEEVSVAVITCFGN